MWALENRKAVVLAASQGLGLGIATEMALAGARVLLVSRSLDKLEKAREEIVQTHHREGLSFAGTSFHEPLVHAADLSDTNSRASLISTAAQQLDGIDIVVNNNGGPPPGRFEQLGPDQWRNAYDLLIHGYMEIFQSSLPHLRKSNAPRFLTVTSISSKEPIPGLVLSNVFRSGLVGLAKTLAQEYAAEGILVNNIAPGMFDTDRLQELDEFTAKEQGRSIEDVRKERTARIPIGRYGDPRELGRAAVFLASSANTMVTGQTLLVDGGLYRGL